MVPGKRTGSWGRNVVRLRSAWTLTAEVAMLSIRIRPDSGTTVARIERARVLLPDPVRPSIAVVDPPGIRRDTFCRTGSRCGAYRMVTFSKTMSPADEGHQAGGSTFPGGSCSKCSSSTTLSTETKSI